MNVPSNSEALLLANSEEPFFAPDSFAGENGPRMVVLVGPCCSGKTTFRRTEYARGYVVLDAGEIYRILAGEKASAFPEPWRQHMDSVGRKVFERAVGERRNLVTEVIGDDPYLMTGITYRMQALGYATEVCYIHAPLEITVRRNLDRPADDLSAYLLEPWHFRWILGLNRTCAP